MYDVDSNVTITGVKNTSETALLNGAISNSATSINLDTVIPSSGTNSHQHLEHSFIKIGDEIMTGTISGSGGSSSLASATRG